MIEWGSCLSPPVVIHKIGVGSTMAEILEFPTREQQAFAFLNTEMSNGERVFPAVFPAT